MKLISTLVLMIFLAFIASPYATLFLIDGNLSSNDLETLSKRVDMESIQAAQKEAMEKNISGLFGSNQNGTFSDIINTGSKILGASAVEHLIDIEWVAQQLSEAGQTSSQDYVSLFDRSDYAFFETPTRFLLQLGKPGESAIYVRMKFEDYGWRVTSIDSE